VQNSDGFLSDPMERSASAWAWADKSVTPHALPVSGPIRTSAYPFLPSCLWGAINRPLQVFPT